MTSNGKQFTVTGEMLTAVACDQSVQLKVAWCCCKNLTAFFKICFCFVLLYNKSLNDWSLGKQWISFPSNLNVSLDFVSGNNEILGTQNSLFSSGPVIKCLILFPLSDMWPVDKSTDWLIQKLTIYRLFEWLTDRLTDWNDCWLIYAHFSHKNDFSSISSKSLLSTSKRGRVERGGSVFIIAL